MKNSEIEWTTHTFNPWQGCSRVSDGCKHCYAAAIARRFEASQGVIWGPQGTRVRTSPTNWKQPIRWNRDAESRGVRARVFCASMADVFEEGRDAELDPIRLDLLDLISKTPCLDWQLLTKRPQHIAFTLQRLDFPADHFLQMGNVWLGTSTENDEWAEKRIPHLVKVPAVVHFISAEPLIGPLHQASLEGIDWVIAGGESAPNPRVMKPEWVTALRDRCQRGSIPFFFKQWGGRNKKETGRLLEGRTWDEFPSASGLCLQVKEEQANGSTL